MIRSLLALLLWAGAAGAGEIVVETARFRLVLGDDAVCRALVDKAAGKDTCARGKAIPIASIRIQDGAGRASRTCAATSAAMAGDALTLGFQGCDTRLVYAIERTPDWALFRLERVEGARPTHVTLLRLGVTLAEHVGPRLNCGWDERSAACLMAADLHTQGRARRRTGFAELTATTQDAPGPKLEGAAAALVVCPTDQLDGILQKLSAACRLPRNEADGTPAKRLPIARQSYWFLSFGESDAERVIDCCRRSGFRQVMMGSGSWCRTVGHYTFHTSRYPDGIESLRRTVAKLHDAGILVGMHCFASKISKTDAYVTPVPDRRFWTDRTASVAAAVGPTDDSIRTSSDLSQWPGSPACTRTIWEGGVAKHQEAVIDDEIVRYKTIGPEGKWDTFLGCERGAWGTKAAPHTAATPCRHYGVDGCINGYIIDQETTLLDETTTRLAHIFNTCGFDMVYFDGGEDVDRRRFTHYVSKFQATVMGKFTKRPIIHMGTIMTHGLWHSFTRSGTVDTYWNTVRGRIIAGGTWEKMPTVRDHIDRSVRYMQSIGEDRMPGELGWFGIWPRRGELEGLQLDEAEYLMCKSLAHDAPISLQTSFSQMDAHPLTPGILEVVRAYETLRLGGNVDEETRRRLREPGKDFILVQQGGRAEFVEAAASPVAGSGELRSLVGQRKGAAVATLWHATGREGTLRMAIDASAVQAADIAGKPLKVEADGGGARVAFGPLRTTLAFPGRSAEAARKLLAAATLAIRPPARLWVQAESPIRIVGQMAKGSAAGVREDGAFGDVVLCTGRPNRTEPQEWYCEYRVDVPHEGRWTLWARVRYPSGADDSFGIVRPGQKVTLSGTQVLGNCGVTGKKWHWTGRGGGSTDVPPARPITFLLPKGPFTFRIHAREGGGTTAVNPRLDCLCLTDEPDAVPTDAEAKAAFE